MKKHYAAQISHKSLKPCYHKGLTRILGIMQKSTYPTRCAPSPPFIYIYIYIYNTHTHIINNNRGENLRKAIWSNELVDLCIPICSAEGYRRKGLKNTLDCGRILTSRLMTELIKSFILMYLMAKHLFDNQRILGH